MQGRPSTMLMLALSHGITNTILFKVKTLTSSLDTQHTRTLLTPVNTLRGPSEAFERTQAQTKSFTTAEKARLLVLQRSPHLPTALMLMTGATIFVYTPTHPLAKDLPASCKWNTSSGRAPYRHLPRHSGCHRRWWDTQVHACTGEVLRERG